MDIIHCLIKSLTAYIVPQLVFSSIVAVMRFTFIVAVCFTLNYTIGSGFLTLPWAFYEAGLILGPCILILFGALAMGSAWFVLEAMARASALRKMGECGEGDLKSGDQPLKLQSATSGPNNNDNFHYGALDSEAKNAELDKSGQGEKEGMLCYPLSLSNHRVEMVDLCEVFLGQSGKLIYLFLVGVYMYGSMWAYSSVFASSWAKAFPLSDFSFESCYSMYLLLWACIEVPWSACELDEQIAVQVTLTMGRVVLVLVMCTTVLVCDFNHENAFLLQKHVLEREIMIFRVYKTQRLGERS